MTKKIKIQYVFQGGIFPCKAFAKVDNRELEVWAAGETWEEARENLLDRLAGIDLGSFPPPDEEIEVEICD